MQPRPALEVRNLCRSFGGLRATADVSFSVPAGAVTALVGPNGAGKTTLFNLITGIIRPSSGEVLFDGSPITGASAGHIASLGLIRTFQTARVFPGLTVWENAMVGAHRSVRTTAIGHMCRMPSARAEERRIAERAEAMLEMVGLQKYRDAHAVELPMGSQKLLEVVRALMASPRLLLLDEPAAGLNDTETAELATLLRAIQATGVTVLVVEHNMALVMSVSAEIVVLEAGAVLVRGRPEDVRADPRVIRAYLGAETRPEGKRT
jgi:branched-chain amino acid transport system ATP-binding protein